MDSEAGPPTSSFCPFPQSRSRDRGGRRTMTRSDGLRSDESYGSANARLHAHIISSSIRYRHSANESTKNPRMGMALAVQTSIRGRTRTSRAPGPSEGFGTEDGWVILPGMSWNHEEPPLEEEAANGPIPAPETALRNAQPPVNHEARKRGSLHPFLEPFLPLNQTIARRPPP